MKPTIYDFWVDGFDFISAVRVDLDSMRVIEVFSPRLAFLIGWTRLSALERCRANGWRTGNVIC